MSTGISGSKHVCSTSMIGASRLACASTLIGASMLAGASILFGGSRFGASRLLTSCSLISASSIHTLFNQPVTTNENQKLETRNQSDLLCRNDLALPIHS